MKIHREGYWYIVIATILWIGLAWTAIYLIPDSVSWIADAITFILFLLWFWVVIFFRLPLRNMVHGEDKIICPADGKVVVIEETYEPEYFKDKRLQVSVFMSPINVHVNRNPVSGVVKYMKYHAGKYLVAWHPKSSTENERTTIVIGNDNGDILMRQIAGALARRICYYVGEGDVVKQNEEFGFIKFGSRVDLFLPLGTVVDVKIGDVVKGGVTVIAHNKR
ncbi:phosphatidylserine decarboxylase family protein [Nemorincola caseinilytica]|uniref:Phosphatidylserine decarboxylase proenzyme n=1 Tax=Nemorincola caseinilytica TaxID=2054315 RepID=A0ABP8NIR9_9BACT